MPSTKPFPERIRRGEPLFGTCITSPSPRWPDALEGAGLDFVFIDTEHIALERTQVSWMCQAYARMNLPPLVRVPAPDPYTVTMMLDGGAAGVVMPYVETVDEVRDLVGAVKFRPIKGQKLTNLLLGEKPSRVMGRYMAQRAQHRAVVVNIESMPAIENLDAILAVPGIDGVLIGPHDLSCSLDIPEEWEHPKFRAAVRNILRRARKAGVGAGIHFFGDLRLSQAFLKEGANLYVHHSDVTLFAGRVQREVALLRGDGAPGAKKRSPALGAPEKVI